MARKLDYGSSIEDGGAQIRGTARVAPSLIDPTKDQIALENTAAVDLLRWDLGELTEQAIILWREGEF